MKKREIKFVEENVREHLRMRYQISETVFSAHSLYQKIEIVQTTGYGKMLLNDDLVMLSEKDEFIYHDMIAHVPLFIHPKPENILIIGGGDGGTAREVLRHKTVAQVTMVEIDQMVVDACLKYIPQTSCELYANEKLKVIIGDGIDYVKNIKREKKERFDIILVDSTDPIGPATPLFGEAFYQDVYDCLSQDGIVISQGENCHYELAMQEKLMSILSQQFPIATIYNFQNLTYPGGLWSFTFASKGPRPLLDFKRQKVAESGLKFKYYNCDIHKAAFSLPTFQRERLKKFINV